MMSCPLPAHPRPMDFSFMSLPPLPPAIFPSLPLRHSPTPLIPAVTLYHPLSTTIICCLFVLYFCHHRCQVSPPVFVDWRMGSVALPPLSSSSLLNFLVCSSISYHIKMAHHRLLIVAFTIAVWCLPPGGILDGMGALSLSFPLAVFPPYPSFLRLPPHLLARPFLGGRVPCLIQVHHHLAEGDVISP